MLRPKYIVAFSSYQSFNKNNNSHDALKFSTFFFFLKSMNEIKISAWHFYVFGDIKQFFDYTILKRIIF